MNRNKPNPGLTQKKCFEKLLKWVKLPQKSPEIFYMG